MTAPDKIWTAPTDGKCHVGFNTKSMNYTIEYTRTDLAQAAVAATYEAAAQVAIDRKGFGSDAALVHPYDKGYVAACDAIATAIRALATPDQIAALAASPDTIPLPRAEVEALMEAAQLVSDWDEWALQIGGVCPDRLVGCLGKMRLSLATLQERMK